MKVFTKADVKLSILFLNVVFFLQTIENLSRDIFLDVDSNWKKNKTPGALRHQCVSCKVVIEHFKPNCAAQKGVMSSKN